MPKWRLFQETIKRQSLRWASKGRPACLNPWSTLWWLQSLETAAGSGGIVLLQRNDPQSTLWGWSHGSLLTHLLAALGYNITERDQDNGIGSFSGLTIFHWRNLILGFGGWKTCCPHWGNNQGPGSFWDYLEIQDSTPKVHRELRASFSAYTKQDFMKARAALGWPN